MGLSILLNIDSETPSDIILFFGRIHPLVVHLPIGFLLLAGLAEVSTRSKKFEPIKPFTQYIWVLGVIGAFFAVLFGYFLSLSGDYNEDTIFWHKWSGVALLLLSLVCYYISKKKIKIPFYGKPVLVTLVIVTIFYTGHLGGNLTHGSTYLMEYAPNPIRQLAGLPKKAIPRKKVTVIDSADVYLDLVSPIMNDRCVSCHNTDKKKGGLELTNFSDVMRGGENGDVIIPGDANSSDLFRRITLPDTHDDFMPTEGKRPLTEDEVNLIGWWINKKAPSNGSFTALNPEKEMMDNVNRQLGLDRNKFLREPVRAPKKEVIDSLNNQGFILNLLMKDNYFLEANFSLSEKELATNSFEMLLQIKDQLIWLNLSNSNVSDKNLEKIGQLENLIKLNLSRNKISDIGLIHLEKLKNLESLNLFGTEVSNKLLIVIPKFMHLKRLYLSKSNATDEIVSQLKKENKKLKIIFD